MPTIQFLHEQSDGHEIEVAIEYRVERGERGARDRYGALTSPPTADSIEIESVSDEDGAEVALTASELRRAERLCYEDALKRTRENSIP